METKRIPKAMLAMLFDSTRGALYEALVPVPVPGPDEVLLKVRTCGVCRTDLHILDQDLPPHKSPLILGHEIVGEIVQIGSRVRGFSRGERVGVPWLAKTCGKCNYCRRSKENLCDAAQFTGYDRDGGYAQYAAAEAHYCFSIPEKYDDLHAAPLLCAGLIGYRAYAMTDDAQHIGIYGFGAAAHIIAQVAKQQGKQIYAFTKPGDTRAQDFARSLGSAWAGDSNQVCPVLLDAAILFAPSGALVPQALSMTKKGGIVVCAGIHMSTIPSFPYTLLWGERTICSVANLTRADGQDFFTLANQLEIQISPVAFALQEANQALDALRAGAFDGAAVLVASS
jgi:alcohol dehydrogenase, propanol-preferring